MAVEVAAETTVMSSKPTTTIVEAGAIMSIMAMDTSKTTRAKRSGDTMVHVKLLTEVESSMKETLYKETVATIVIMPTDVRMNIRWFLITNGAGVVTAMILDDAGAALEVVLDTEHTMAAANVVETRNSGRVACVWIHC